jgi:hypothetical protein
MRITKWVFSIGMVILLFAVTGCNFLVTATPTNPLTATSTSPHGSDSPVPYSVSNGRSKALLYVDGYGYEYGDIVLLDTVSSPKTGDIVLYNANLNKSNSYTFGPNFLLVKVIALQGESVVFEKWTYGANGYEVTLREHEWPQTMNVLWGAALYDNVNGLTLPVPADEYLADKWIGREGYQRGTDLFPANRFTVKREAICGVVLKKDGHKDIPLITY